MVTSGFNPVNLGNAPGASEEPSDLERTVRFAGFTLGGLVMLALGVLLVVGYLGPVLECVYHAEFCGGSGTWFYFLTVPGLGAGFALTAIAVVLLLLGRNSR